MALKDEGKREDFDDSYNSGFGDGIIEMVKNMLKENASVDFISKVTNLSLEEIKHIKDSN